MKKKFFLKFIIILLLFLNSCVNEFNVDFNYEQKPDLFCLLKANDTIKVFLFNSILPNETSTWKNNIIKNATIILFENDKKVQTNFIFNGNYYFSSYKPKQGFNYKLKIAIPSSDTLFASTYIPYHDSFKTDSYNFLMYNVEENYFKRAFNINFKIETNHSLYHWWYFDMFFGVADIYYSKFNSFVNDKFKYIIYNSTIDTNYNFLFIISDLQIVDGQDVVVDSISIDVILNTLSSDAYFFMLSYNNTFPNDFYDLPFEYLSEPSIIYQNVKNGYGIFAGYSSDTLHINLKIPQNF